MDYNRQPVPEPFRRVDTTSCGGRSVGLVSARATPSGCHRTLNRCTCPDGGEFSDCVALRTRQAVSSNSIEHSQFLGMAAGFFDHPDVRVAFDPPGKQISTSSSLKKKPVAAVPISELLHCEGGIRSSRGLVLVGCATGLGQRLHADELEAEILQPVEESVQL